MPNENVYNQEELPLSVQMSNTYQSPGIMAPPETGASGSGRLFSLSNASSGTVVLNLINVNCSIRVNNAGSRTMYLSRIIFSIGGSSILSNLSGTALITKGGTLSSPSTATPLNTNFGSSVTSAMTVQTSSSTISGGTQVMQYQMAPGELILDFAGSIIIPPGQSLCANAVSSSSSVGLTISSSVTLVWWEV